MITPLVLLGKKEGRDELLRGSVDGASRPFGVITKVFDRRYSCIDDPFPFGVFSGVY